MTENLMTVKQLAKYLKIGKTKLYQLIREKKIPYIRLGHAIRFSQDNIRFYMEQTRVDKEGAVKF